jgi:acetyl-CoA C-acetyltransferase
MLYVCLSQYSREQQDDFALESYKRAAAAWDSGNFSEEVLQLEVPQKRGAAVTVTKDQEYTAVDAKKVRSVRPAFKKDGSVTAPNASTLNDGAAAMVSCMFSCVRFVMVKS